MDLISLTDCGRFHGGGRGSPRASTACDPCPPPWTATGGHGQPQEATGGHGQPREALHSGHRPAVLFEFLQ